MRIALLVTTVFFFNLIAQADVYGEAKITNVTTEVQAFKEFESLREKHALQINKKQRTVKKSLDIMYIKANSSPTIVGYTVQEIYTISVAAKTIRKCMTEIHTSDLSQPASVGFSCQTEQF